MHGADAPSVLLVSACVLLGAVVVWDVRERRVPNVLAALLGASGVIVAALHGSWEGLGASLVGVLVGGGLLLWPYSKGWMGAGDVKLLGAIGAWVGGGGAVFVLLVGSILGGVLAAGSWLRLAAAERAEVGRTLAGVFRGRGLRVPPPSRLSRARGIPFGVPLSLVTLALLLARGLS